MSVWRNHKTSIIKESSASYSILGLHRTGSNQPLDWMIDSLRSSWDETRWGERWYHSSVTMPRVRWGNVVLKLHPWFFNMLIAYYYWHVWYQWTVILTQTVQTLYNWSIYKYSTSASTVWIPLIFLLFFAFIPLSSDYCMAHFFESFIFIASINTESIPVSSILYWQQLLLLLIESKYYTSTSGTITIM